jgi:hypothetical protein
MLACYQMMVKVLHIGAADLGLVSCCSFLVSINTGITLHPKYIAFGALYKFLSHCLISTDCKIMVALMDARKRFPTEVFHQSPLPWWKTMYYIIK